MELEPTDTLYSYELSSYITQNNRLSVEAEYVRFSIADPDGVGAYPVTLGISSSHGCAVDMGRAKNSSSVTTFQMISIA
jgi:hypothetical protein